MWVPQNLAWLTIGINIVIINRCKGCGASWWSRYYRYVCVYYICSCTGIVSYTYLTVTISVGKLTSNGRLTWLSWQLMMVMTMLVLNLLWKNSG